MKEKKGLPIFLRILKITVIAVVLLTLVIFFIGMIDAFADKNALPEKLRRRAKVDIGETCIPVTDSGLLLPSGASVRVSFEE